MLELEHSGKMTSKFLIFSSDGNHFQRVNLKNQRTNKQKKTHHLLGWNFRFVLQPCGAAPVRCRWQWPWPCATALGCQTSLCHGGLRRWAWPVRRGWRWPKRRTGNNKKVLNVRWSKWFEKGGKLSICFQQGFLGGHSKRFEIRQDRLMQCGNGSKVFLSR